ncbi:SHOCT domain-containing protein [Streptomyces mexicanus]|uniref:SHOCT domain-containing protein n=1 Tax=Streptomyces mexicanus TaxID=178566 RepID=UPI001357DA6F|nr:SHOCT domain-containing protein [Streptomyces mexicanus]
MLLLPLLRAIVIGGAVAPLRRPARRGRGGPWRGPDGPWRGGAGRPAGDSPLAVLGRRFASGEIDEDEYRRRLSVLEEQFGRPGKGGAGAL